MKKTILNEQGLAITDVTVQVYNVNPQTQEYNHPSDEFLAMGVGLPAYSYLDKPLAAKEGFVVCRTESGWQYQIDLRDTVVYTKANGQESKVTKLGELPNEVTLLKPVTEFDRWQDERWVTDLTAKKQAEMEHAKAEKQQLSHQASMEIEKLNDAIELEMVQDGDQKKLDDWRKYRILLARVNLEQTTDIVWPVKPN